MRNIAFLTMLSFPVRERGIFLYSTVFYSFQCTRLALTSFVKYTLILFFLDAIVNGIVSFNLRLFIANV